jgi:hypothetical protein
MRIDPSGVKNFTESGTVGPEQLALFSRRSVILNFRDAVMRTSGNELVVRPRHREGLAHRGRDLSLRPSARLTTRSRRVLLPCEVASAEQENMLYALKPWSGSPRVGEVNSRPAGMVALPPGQ